MKTSINSNAISRQKFLHTLALGATLVPAATLLAQDTKAPADPESAPDMGNLRTFVALARSDIRRQRALILAENLPLTEDEAVDFWPVEREYETDLGALLDERYDGIVQFAHDYGSMTDDQASALAKKSFDLEGKRTALKKKYFGKFCKVIPPVKAARFFQIDNQLNMAIDLRVAASLPLIK